MPTRTETKTRRRNGKKIKNDNSPGVRVYVKGVVPIVNPVSGRRFPLNRRYGHLKQGTPDNAAMRTTRARQQTFTANLIYQMRMHHALIFENSRKLYRCPHVNRWEQIADRYRELYQRDLLCWSKDGQHSRTPDTKIRMDVAINQLPYDEKIALYGADAPVITDNVFLFVWAPDTSDDALYNYTYDRANEWDTLGNAHAHYALVCAEHFQRLVEPVLKEIGRGAQVDDFKEQRLQADACILRYRYHLKTFNSSRIRDQKLNIVDRYKTYDPITRAELETIYQLYAERCDYDLAPHLTL